MRKQRVSQCLRQAWTEKFGTPPPERMELPVDVDRDAQYQEDVLAMFRQGLACHTIAKQLGTNPKRVSAIVTGAGLSLYRCKWCLTPLGARAYSCNDCKALRRKENAVRKVAGIKRKAQNRIAAGLCSKCGKQPLADARLCAACRENDRRHGRRADAFRRGQAYE